MGGHAYLSYLVAAVPTSVFVDHYAQIVRRTAMLRRLINAAGQIAALGYEGGPDSDAVLSEAERIILSLGGGRSVQDFMLIRDVIDEYLEDPKDEDGMPASRASSRSSPGWTGCSGASTAPTW